LEDKKSSIGFTYALNGIKEAFKSERNFRLHLLSTILVIIVGIYLKINVGEWIAIVIVIGLVITAELFNTAIEEIINYMKPEIHPAAKKIKDLAAAGVLLTSITALIVGLIIFMPKFF
jgi:undecaprenol kinase